MSALFALAGALAALWVVTDLAGKTAGMWLASIFLIIFVAMFFSAIVEIGEQFRDQMQDVPRPAFFRRRRR